MKKANLEWKVGLFVAIALAVFAAIVIKFSKGASVFESTYDLYLETRNVGGIVPGAMVQIAGVAVGSVVDTDLQPDGKTVIIRLKIKGKYKIYKNADFSIKQAGFLGDRYVSVVTRESKGELLEPGAKVNAEEPFDLQEVARSAAGLLQRVDDTAKRLNDAVTRIDRTLFAEQTLTNLTVTVANFRTASEQTLVTLQGVDQFVRTNTHPLSASVSNLVSFSEQMKEAAKDLHETISTNQAEVTTIVKNIESVTKRVDKLVEDLQDGKGLAGSLLKNPELEQSFRDTMSNMSSLSSNLNKHGILWKPKTPRPVTPPIYTGKNPYR